MIEIVKPTDDVRICNSCKSETDVMEIMVYMHPWSQKSGTALCKNCRRELVRLLIENEENNGQ